MRSLWKAGIPFAAINNWSGLALAFLNGPIPHCYGHADKNLAPLM